MERWDKIGHCMRYLGLEHHDSILIIDIERMESLHVPPFPPNLPVLITGLRSTEQLAILEKCLEQVYPSDHQITCIEAIDTASEVQAHPRILSLESLSMITIRDGEFFLFVPALGKKAAFEEFVEIIARLRDPQGGCPWDLKQTHQSLRPHLISETYEVLSALDTEDDDALVEELGDLLLQIVLHAQIAGERGNFSITQVLEKIYTKIVGRHPHVFGELNLDDVQGVLRNWEKLKAAERESKNRKWQGSKKKDLLDGVPLALPALIQAQEYLERTERIGVRWKTWHELIGEIRKMLEHLDQKNGGENRPVFGKILFDLANLASIVHIDAESSLREENQEFRGRLGALGAKDERQVID